MRAVARVGGDSRCDEGPTARRAPYGGPLGLLDEIRAVQYHLAALAAGATVHPMPQRDADLDAFLRSLALAWRAGEVRPTHRPRKRPPRHWRTRRDPLRDDLARCRAVAGSRTATDGEGALRASTTRAPRDVRAGPASDSATSRQGLAPARGSAPPLRRSDRTIPRRSRVRHHGTRTFTRAMRNRTLRNPTTTKVSCSP